MRTLQRMLIAAGLFMTAHGLAPSARAQEPLSVEIKPIIEPIAPPAQTSGDPMPTETAMLPDTKAAGVKHHAEKEKKHILAAIWRWACYAPTRLPCSYGWQPTPHYPPLYTWTYGQRGGCNYANGAYCHAQPQPVGMTRRFEEPLPKPEMPAIARKEQPLVPGSLSVMAEKRDETELAPMNYKSLPVVPPDPSGRH